MHSSLKRLSFAEHFKPVHFSGFGGVLVRYSGKQSAVITAGHCVAAPVYARRHSDERGDMYDCIYAPVNLDKLEGYADLHIATDFFRGELDLAIAFKEKQECPQTAIREVLAFLEEHCASPDIVDSLETRLLVMGETQQPDGRGVLCRRNTNMALLTDVGFPGLSGNSAVALPQQSQYGMYTARLSSSNDEARRMKIQGVMDYGAQYWHAPAAGTVTVDSVNADLNVLRSLPSGSAEVSDLECKRLIREATQAQAARITNGATPAPIELSTDGEPSLRDVLLHMRHEFLAVNRQLRIMHADNSDLIRRRSIVIPFARLAAMRPSFLRWDKDVNCCCVTNAKCIHAFDADTDCDYGLQSQP